MQQVLSIGFVPWWVAGPHICKIFGQTGGCGNPSPLCSSATKKKEYSQQVSQSVSSSVVSLSSQPSSNSLFVDLDLNGG